MAAYVDITDANTYMAARLHTQPWDRASDVDKGKALVMATTAIDRLRFTGDKNAVYLARQANGCDEDALRAAWETQELEFPRGADVEIPADIIAACCEEALSLLDGKDPTAELEDLSTISQGYSSVRVTSDRTFVQEHLNAGFGSPMAWRFLKPYLGEPRSIKLLRVD